MTDQFAQGISSGWADIYDWYLPDQYIDVAGIGNGIYILETRADPDDLLMEADETNNRGRLEPSSELHVKVKTVIVK